MPPLIFTSLSQYLAACLVLICAETVYVLFGFGAGLIAVGLLAVFLPEIRDVVVLLLLINLPIELWVVTRARRQVSWRGVLAICLGVAVGIPLGTRVLQAGESTLILVMLGIFLVVAGTGFMIAPRHRVVRWPRWSAPPVGLLGGLLTGIFGTGGPPLILYYQLGGANKAAFRGNLMAIFLLMAFLRVPSYAVAGLITAPRLWSALAVLPAVLLGAWLGNRIHLRLAEDTFRRLVSVALVVLGIFILLRISTPAP